MALALFAFSRDTGGAGASRGRGSSSPTFPGSTGQQRPLTRTGEASTVEWARRRLALLLASFQSLEPPLEGDLADRVGLSLLAQWAHETARGRAEFNFNLGGWTARKGDDFHTATDRLSGKPGFRWTAYPDLPTAIEDQLRRLILTYPSAWSLLVAEPESSSWVEELGRRGYYTARPADYARAWAMQRLELKTLLGVNA